jgi:hypothetical protein
VSWGAAFIKIPFAFQAFRFFLHSGTPLTFIYAFTSFFLRSHSGTLKNCNIQVPIYRGSFLKRAALVLLSFLAAAYQVHCLIF